MVDLRLDARRRDEREHPVGVAELAAAQAGVILEHLRRVAAQAQLRRDVVHLVVQLLAAQHAVAEQPPEARRLGRARRLEERRAELRREAQLGVGLAVERLGVHPALPGRLGAAQRQEVRGEGLARAGADDVADLDVGPRAPLVAGAGNAVGAVGAGTGGGSGQAVVDEEAAGSSWRSTSTRWLLVRWSARWRRRSSFPLKMSSIIDERGRRQGDGWPMVSETDLIICTRPTPERRKANLFHGERSSRTPICERGRGRRVGRVGG